MSLPMNGMGLICALQAWLSELEATQAGASGLPGCIDVCFDCGDIWAAVFRVSAVFRISPVGQKPD